MEGHADQMHHLHLQKRNIIALKLEYNIIMKIVQTNFFKAKKTRLSITFDVLFKEEYKNFSFDFRTSKKKKIEKFVEK